jgi:rubredoxin
MMGGCAAAIQEFRLALGSAAEIAKRCTFRGQGPRREPTMDRWECPCGYIYDPAEGDAERGISVGTAFEDLPEDWVCPLCGAEKEYFEKMD